MRKIVVLFMLSILFCISPLYSQVPRLDELAGEWIKTSTIRNFPTVNNFWGGLKTTRNITAFELFISPPYSMSGWCNDLLVGGKTCESTESRWYPYQVLRRTDVDGIQLVSSTRMAFEQRSVLCRLQLTNTTNETKDFSFTMCFHGRARYYPPEIWHNWDAPMPGGGQFFVAEMSENNHVLKIADQHSPSALAVSFVQAPKEARPECEKAWLDWTLTINPGETKTIEYVVSVNSTPESALALSKGQSENFRRSFRRAKTLWQQRWEQAFDTFNPFYTGHLPTLETDDAKLRRLYYHSALVPLTLCRTNLPLHKRVVVDAGPQYAATITYFWDATLLARTWSRMDPVEFKKLAARWLALDEYTCYATCALTENGAGLWYGTNSWAIFQCADDYMNVTGDRGFLTEKTGDKTVIDQLERLATAYRALATEGSLLGDYGGMENMLECAPTYIERVPSVNSTNVAMLRRVAYYLDHLAYAGYNTDEYRRKANAYRDEANALSAEIIALYVPGEGVWNALHRDGTKAQLRHCLDYVFMGQHIPSDLTASMKEEMTQFVLSELVDENWIRAMSPKDSGAPASIWRSDHGPTGAYTAWPSEVSDVMIRFGHMSEAIGILRRAESVTWEGALGQSYEYVPHYRETPDQEYRMRNVFNQSYNEICGSSYMDVFTRTLFGCEDDCYEPKLKLLLPNVPRGFNGKLKNVTYHGKDYNIVSDEKGLHLE